MTNDATPTRNATDRCYAVLQDGTVEALRADNYTNAHRRLVQA